VAPASTPADKFLSFHSKMSAAARHKQLGSTVKSALKETTVMHMALPIRG
jgi:hypothetical protein